MLERARTFSDRQPGTAFWYENSNGLAEIAVPHNAKLAAAGRVLERARIFIDRSPGTAFWYENSNGLAEIAVNQGRADRELGLSIGVPVEIVS